MFKQRAHDKLCRSNGKHLPLSLLLCLSLLGVTGCGVFQSDPNKTITTESGEKIDLNDETVKQYVEEWANSKPSIDRLAEMENDLVFLLAEVSKMSDLGQVPGTGIAKTSTTSTSTTTTNTQKTAAPFAGTTAATTTAAPVAATTAATDATSMTTTQTTVASNTQPVTTVVTQVPTTFTQTSTGATAYAMGTGAPINTPGQFLCPEPFNNDYKKSVAFVSFPRMVPVSSSLGALQQVEQHLPMLIGANLRNRHSMLTPTYLRESFASASLRGEINAAAQAQALSKHNRVQFFVSGEVDDMTLTFPDSVENPSYFTRFVSGAHNLLHINTSLDKRSRVFSFKLEVRDGFTGQIIFSNQYRTFGKWKASPETQMGFGSPRFWETDYGVQVQHLVAKASDDMASAINCQPYMARIDSSPGQQQVVIHSGTNNGMHSGDTLDLYQLVYQPVTGEYQRFDTRLVKRNGRVYLTEIYPSHSIGHVVDETLLSGQYLVKAR